MCVCRLKDTDITAFAVHPGLIMTNIWATKWATNGFMAKLIGVLCSHWFKSIQQVGTHRDEVKQTRQLCHRSQQC